jgi:hypothetical protein
MARGKASVRTFPELQRIADNLVRKYRVAFEGVDPSRILFLQSDSKHSKRVAKISAIRVPHPSVTPFRFAITVFPMFLELDEARQVLHVLRELRRIEDFENSKVGKYELQDFADIIEKYGTIWEDREDISLEDVFGVPKSSVVEGV